MPQATSGRSVSNNMWNSELLFLDAQCLMICVILISYSGRPVSNNMCISDFIFRTN